MEAATCRACKAPMIWTVTERGKNMPVDADPVEDGTFGLFTDGDEVSAIFVNKAREREDWDGDLYKPHWATCPHAANFR